MSSDMDDFLPVEIDFEFDIADYTLYGNVFWDGDISDNRPDNLDIVLRAGSMNIGDYPELTEDQLEAVLEGYSAELNSYICDELLEELERRGYEP